MFRLGLRLATLSGRETLIRILVTAAAIAIGVATLLVVLADFNAYQVTTNRPYWEGTHPSATAVTAASSNIDLWNFSEDYFQGRIIERLDVAAVGPDAPVIPGLTSMPGPGQYYVSPALASLLKTVLADELGNRFPGTEVGTIGDAGLASPDALVIVIGHTPQELAAWPNVEYISHINTATQSASTNNVYNAAFILATIALIVPLLIFVGTATRLGAARREERYASLRLIGATPRQVGIFASVEAVLGALLGTVVGVGLFLLLQPTVAGIEITGSLYFPSYVTPTLWGYLGMLIGVPLASAVASMYFLRRVQLSPLEVRRRGTPPPPAPWGLFVLAVGLVEFILTIHITKNGGFVLPALGLVLTMVGLVMAGSWLTRQLARLLARVTGGASTLLAARRLADAPQAAFRSVSGLVMAVLLGTVLAILASTVLVGSLTPQNIAMSDVLRVDYGARGGAAGGLSHQTWVGLSKALSVFPGTSVLPLYVNPDAGQPLLPGPHAGPPVRLSESDYRPEVISSADLAQFPLLGTGPSGASAVTVNANNLLFDDNPVNLSSELQLVTPDSPVFTGTTDNLSVAAVMVRTDSPVTLERVRTVLSEYAAPFATNEPPQTFGEMAQVRIGLIDQAERVVFAVMALILIVAGCSLAVAVSGSLIERQRPFTLLRLTGTPLSALYRVVFLESALPLLTAALLAAGLGFGMAIAFINGTAPAGIKIVFPGLSYYLTVVAGLVVSLLVILLSTTLLGRLTRPENARFE